jgi:phosphoenolpyruvate carboxylase
MCFRRKKTDIESRRETYETIYDLVKEIEVTESKAKNDKFKTYLKELREKIQFSVNNNKRIPKRTTKNFTKTINDIYNLLNHELWHSRKIKRKLRYIEDLNKEIELL